MVEVFKTDVQQLSQARTLILLLLQHFPYCKINFDLQDCDKVLRIEGHDFITSKVITLIKDNGFLCSIME